MNSFESDPLVLWAIRAWIWLLFFGAVALGVRVMCLTLRGQCDPVDLLRGPGGRLSNMATGYYVALGVGAIAVLRDAADGTASWELLAVFMGLAGAADVAKRGLNVLETIRNGGKHAQDGGSGAAGGGG